MLLSTPKLVVLLKKVDQVREELARTCLGKPEPTLRIMDLKYVVEQMYGFSIEMIEVDFAAQYLKGHILRFGDKRAQIIVRAGLSPAERRLVAIKELCHLILDEEEDFAIDGAAIVDGLLTEALTFQEDGIGIPDPSLPEQSEILAVLAANELGYPREYHDADRAKLDADETTLSAIAIQHGLPPYMISHALDMDKVMDRVRGLITDSERAAAE